MDDVFDTERDSHDRPSNRFGEFLRLSAEERAVVAELLGPPQHYPRHHVLRREGTEPLNLHLLLGGWVAASLSLPTGKQQIVKVHLPGDLLGAPSLSLKSSAETLTTLTPVAAQPLSRSRLIAAFARHPRLAITLFLSAQKERVSLMDRLALVGQADAHVRIAALLVDLFDRLSAIGQARDGAFAMPLTQRDLGDLVGITPVHVNRTLRAMDKANLIRRSDQTITLLDIDRLRGLTGLPRRDFVFEPDWLPFR
ncbi:Crp/Fnr family transcriptional regulator [Brevundimonas sp. SORGH_AS_0993]|uniref:Crp/Fnr family transcriptional regulator n=1 Tax=Brevundimonas sp. SORGH_AS_0993 TaxID=3041794 RepID=UPI002786262D|nr:Crp/Fnr family transcriptional regulator [Brevundimonas sp. SORGH_AS_0993]MDQ1154185.1 CRP/FNR family transcriptional regulator [Brevundimonas sp. SORGH_AS_0993]